MSFINKLRNSLIEGVFSTGYSEQYGGHTPPLV